MENIQKDIKQKMQKQIDIFQFQINKIHTGRISSNILDDIKIDYYGKYTPLKQLSNIVVENFSTLKISLFDSSLHAKVKKSILSSKLDLNPVSSDNNIRVFFPVLTETKRKKLIKIIHSKAEEYKINIRNIRRDFNEKIKCLLKNKNITQDEQHYLEIKIQKITNNYIKNIETMCLKKENDLKII